MLPQKIDNNPILKLCFEFSISLIEFCEKLNLEKRFIVSNQLLRAGTAIGAHSMEAQNAESRSDFIHKFKIAAKEAEEAQYWLLLCQLSYKHPECELLLIQLVQIQKLLYKIITSSKNA